MFKGDENDAPLAAVDMAEGTEDPWYLGWCNKIQREPEAYPRWKLTGGQLFYYHPDELVDAAVGDEEAWKTVIPKEFRHEVLAECYDEPKAGHMGRDKTYDRAMRYYYWPHMYKAIRKYVREFLVCQQCKVEQRAPAGLMGKHEISRPWQVVAADIMGPLPKSKHGFEYVIVFENLFSRWVEVIPLRRANAKSISKELKERVILCFGTPEVFLSDNGMEFKNRAVAE